MTNYYINIFSDHEGQLIQVSPDVHTRDHDAADEIRDYEICNGLETFKYIHTIRFNDVESVELIDLS